jgi:hypothetical protein
VDLIGDNSKKYMRHDPPREPWGVDKATRALQSVNQALSKLDQLITHIESIRPLLPNTQIMAHDSQHWCLTMDYRYSAYDLAQARESMERFRRNLVNERDTEATLARRR